MSGTSSWVQSGVERFLDWLNSQRRLRIMLVEDPPDTLEPGLVYLIGDNPDHPWCAALLCPCGCKADIRLSLIPTDEPRWRVSPSPSDSVTIRPSIWRTKGCRSHFYVFKGRIVWARERARVLRP